MRISIWIICQSPALQMHLQVQIHLSAKAKRFQQNY